MGTRVRGCLGYKTLLLGLLPGKGQRPKRKNATTQGNIVQPRAFLCTAFARQRRRARISSLDRGSLVWRRRTGGYAKAGAPTWPSARALGSFDPARPAGRRSSKRPNNDLRKRGVKLRILCEWINVVCFYTKSGNQTYFRHPVRNQNTYDTTSREAFENKGFPGNLRRIFA